MGGRAHDVMIMKTFHALACRGHTVRLVTGRPARRENIFQYYDIEPSPNLEILRVPMLRGSVFSWHGIFNVFCLLKILDLKRKGLADVIYLREMKLARFLLRFKHILNLPFVIEVHDLKIKKFYDSCPEKNDDEAHVFSKVDGVVVLLHTFGTLLKQVYAVDAIPVVKVPLASEKKPFVYKQSGRKTVGYVGQLYPMQGVEILVKAMSYLPDVRLHVIGGKKKDIHRLKELAIHEMVDRRIDFYGFVPPYRVAEKAREADVMVICALNRGKRRYSAHTKLYEYMAMGKPIVAVDIPSVREEITDGKNAIIAKPEDPKDLADKIEKVLHNQELAHSLAVEAYASADEFSWEKRAQKLSDLLLRIHAHGKKYD